MRLCLEIHSFQRDLAVLTSWQASTSVWPSCFCSADQGAFHSIAPSLERKVLTVPEMALSRGQSRSLKPTFIADFQEIYD